MEWTQGGWRPIETAPKDGTEVLLCNGKGAMFTGCWFLSRTGWVWGDQDAGYFVREGGLPAWWMPLPERPSVPSEALVDVRGCEEED